MWTDFTNSSFYSPDGLEATGKHPPTHTRARARTSVDVHACARGRARTSMHALTRRYQHLLLPTVVVDTNTHLLTQTLPPLFPPSSAGVFVGHPSDLESALCRGGPFAGIYHRCVCVRARARVCVCDCVIVRAHARVFARVHACAEDARRIDIFIIFLSYTLAM